MKQSLFSQIEHDKEDVLRLNHKLFKLKDPNQFFEELKSLADSHILHYDYNVKDGCHLFSTCVNRNDDAYCALITTIETSDNSIVKWKQAMILSMCVSVMLAFHSSASALRCSIKLFIVTKDEEISLLSQNKIKDAKFCVFFDWGNETRNSLSSCAVIKNTFIFNSKTIPLGNEEYYGNPILCLSALSAFCSDISSCLSKGAVIRLLAGNIENNNFFHVTSLTVESYTITSDISLAENLSLILSETAKTIAKSYIVNLNIESNKSIEVPFFSDEKLNKIFMHSLKEHGFIETHCAKCIQNAVSAAQISEKIPSIQPCIGLNGTTMEEDIAYRNKRNTVSEEAASSLIAASKAIAGAIYDIFQINGN